jgi:hypothetical protein
VPVNVCLNSDDADSQLGESCVWREIMMQQTAAGDLPCQFALCLPCTGTGCTSTATTTDVAPIDSSSALAFPHSPTLCVPSARPLHTAPRRRTAATAACSRACLPTSWVRTCPCASARQTCPTSARGSPTSCSRDRRCSSSEVAAAVWRQSCSSGAVAVAAVTVAAL